MPKWLILAGLLFVFTSCEEKEREDVAISVEKPSDLIPEDKMIQILADVHLLEGVVTFRGPETNTRSPFMLPPGSQQELPPAGSQQVLPYYDIFSKYGCTRDQYDRSLKWYAQDAAHYSEMYDEVINELSRRQAKEMQNSGKVSPAPGANVK